MKIKNTLLGLCILCVLFGCAKKVETPVVSEGEKEVVFGVNTFVVSANNLDEYLEFGGDVQAKSTVDALPDATGKLVSLKVEVGQYVQKNQVIAEIDPSRPGMNYSVSPVKAPVSGTIVSLPFSVGAMMSPSMSLAKISSTNQLEISISVAERFISKIAMGQKATLRFDAYPNEVFHAKVVQISPVLDTSTRTMKVTLAMDPPDKRIKVGMYARIKLITDSKKDALAIPYSALITRLGEQCLFVLSPDFSEQEGKEVYSVKMIKPQVGIRVDDKVEIVGGLNPGDEIVVKGQTLLEDGSKINVISRQTSLGGAN